MEKILRELARWLEKTPRGDMKLADRLGYNSAMTIHQWLKRGRIPSYQLERVQKIIGGRK